MTESQQDPGLEWISLGEVENIDDILAAAAEFSTVAKFEKDEKGLEYCTAEEVSRTAAPIFATFGSQNKDDFEMRGNALRLREGTTTLTSRSAYLISVQVSGRNPTIGGMELVPKHMVHFKKGIKIKVESESVVDVFFMVETPKKPAMK